MSCLSPYHVRQKITGQIVPVPCGKCPQCVYRRISSWSFRLMQEYNQAVSAHFVTLTYDDATVPLSPSGLMTLRKKDVQLHIKRLRKLQQHDEKIIYYCVGEYGSHTYRPHYHMIIFNAMLETHAASWQHGHLHYGNVNSDSIAYCVAYFNKRPFNDYKDRQKEFSLMSKGIGLSYITPSIYDYHTSDVDNKAFLTVDGYKQHMPRYYKNKLYTEEERKRLAFFARQHHEQRQYDLLQDPDYFLKELSQKQSQFNKFNYETNKRSRV